ncbi:MAG: hypothetical protein J7L92_04695 [Dehalococcoidia bacterium]|nr:hypothetical protein [Dehalococcoidia bacterium]RLC63003.1 MAG: hypothetical protein DRI01_05945 [Chloroflexota bacterium]
MEPLYTGIAIAALIIIVVLLLISRQKGKQLRKPSNLFIIGMTLVVLGIIFIDAGRLISYSFIGVGVLLEIIDAIRNLKSK